MKKLIFLMTSVLCFSLLNAQEQVKFQFSSGVSGELKSKMEKQIGYLFTTINHAQSINSKSIEIPKYLKINNQASQSICMLWEQVHFRTSDSDIVERCLQVKAKGRVIGYQVRNIEIDMFPQNDSYKDDPNQEVCIDFDNLGNIIDFNIAMNKLQFQKLVKEGEDIGDMDKRWQIVQWCEQFKTAYIRKDINYIDNIFSEDALVITGRIINPEPRSLEIGLPDDYVKYTVQDKKNYIDNLRKLFNNPNVMDIGVKFSDYKIKIHPILPNYYGVTLIQDWTTYYKKGKYSDSGYLFLLWDFTNEEKPLIHIRSWQPKGISEKKIFTVNSFRLPNK